MIFRLVRLQLFIVFNHRTWLLLIGVLSLIAWFQTFLLDYLTPINIGEYILYGLGGVHDEDLFARLLIWVLQIILFMQILRELFRNQTYESWTLIRHQSRMMWFISKWISLIIITVGYCLLLLFAYFLIGVFKYPIQITDLTLSLTVSDIGNLSLFYFGGGIYFTGLLALSSIVMTISYLFQHRSASYVMLSVIMVIAFFIWHTSGFPRLLSPISYANVLTALESKESLVASIYQNITIMSIALGTSFIIVVIQNRKCF